MKSYVAISSEIDDPVRASKDLANQIRSKGKFEANSVGIVYCDAEVNVAGLGEQLHKELGIDIAGLTTTAAVERNHGYADMSIHLCVLTAADAFFTIGFSGELGTGEYSGSIHGAYKNAAAKLKDPPKLILALTPYIAEHTPGDYVDILDEAAGGIPIFGGVATDSYDLRFQKTFYNGEEFKRGMVFVLFSGNIRPIFAMEHHFASKADKKGTVTKSEGNKILRVGDQTFKDYVSTIVPVPDEELVVFHFQSTPFVVEFPDHEKDDQPVVRVVISVDHSIGAGSFLSRMPEGTVIYLTELQRDNLKESCRGALTDIIGKMAGHSDYEYSMLFINTCNARNLLMGDVKTLESSILSEKLSSLPPAVNAMGFYGFGEICPTGKRANGSAKNRFHNVSFTICAI